MIDEALRNSGRRSWNVETVKLLGMKVNAYLKKQKAREGGKVLIPGERTMQLERSSEIHGKNSMKKSWTMKATNLIGKYTCK